MLHCSMHAVALLQTAQCASVPGHKLPEEVNAIISTEQRQTSEINGSEGRDRTMESNLNAH